ncbi:hypothetical protein [Nonomuraea sp. SYSU D8015]|uniref:hypothetical protein n=1 Tax=Nonomuraea sp. SYSU D8015 TaxID=2593644 RepID=UPI001CB6DDE2|nr:hypothetical protein [Nonomuraea sp. SYSU D8015]
MRARVAAAAALAPLLQVAVLERLPVAPDLVMLAAVAAGVAMGPPAGAVTGFAAGLAADLVPPALPPAGRTALLFCLLGYACGLLPRKLPAWAGMLVGSAIGGLAATCATLLPGLTAVRLQDLLWSGPAPLAALPCNLIAASLLWRLLTWRRDSAGRHTDATLVTLSTAAGAPAGGRALPHAARPAVAGADPGRRALRRSGRRRPRAPHRHPGRARAHPR